MAVVPVVPVAPFCASADVTRITSALASFAAGDSVDVNRLCLSLSPARGQATAARVLKSLCLFSATLSDPCVPAAHVRALRSLMNAAIYADFLPCRDEAARRETEAAEADAEVKRKAAVRAEALGTAAAEGVEASEEPEEATKGVTFSPETAAAARGASQSPPLGPKATAEDAVVSEELLHSYAFFLENTVSADSAFVEDVLRACASQTFRLPVPQFAGVVDVAVAVVARILKAYSFAERIFLRIVSERYPHPVRAAAEHRSYARAVLAVANRAASSPTLIAGVLSIVVEKLVIVDAMAPEGGISAGAGDALLAGSPSSSASLIEDVSAEAGESPSQCQTPPVLEALTPPPELSPESEKMDIVLSELLEFCNGLSEGAPHFVQARLSAIVSATERFVLPADAAANSPNLLLHAASVCGRTSVLKVVERFRVSFFDPTLPHQMRTTYLCYSAALLTRSAQTTSKDVVSWLKRLTRWIHLYISERSNMRVIVDVDVHRLFYSAVFALMWVVSLRPAVLCTGDIANSMRFLSIMSSDMNPLLVMPPALVASFSKAVEELGGMKFKTVFAENLEKTLPTKTLFGNVNQFSCFFPLARMCSLPSSRALVTDSYYKSGSLRKARSCLGQIGSLLDLQALNGKAPVMKISQKRCRSADDLAHSPSATEEDHGPAKRRRLAE